MRAVKVDHSGLNSERTGSEAGKVCPSRPSRPAALPDGQFKSWCTARIRISAPLLFTANDCLDIGEALGSPVSLEYRKKAPCKFNGKINQVHVQYVTGK
jgi:hypothetical protein